MLYRLLLTLVSVSITSGLVACDSCASNAGKAQPQSDGPTRDPPAVPLQEMLNPIAGYRARAEDLGPFDGSLLRYAGELDFKNRYSSVVLVTTGNPSEGAQCSGVLLGPRLVLTAGSCPCQARAGTSGNGDERISTASACARRASVMTVIYGTVHDESTADREVQQYEGTVRLHPDLELVFDEKSSVVTSRADLAVILLDEPVEESIPYAALPKVDVTTTEFLVMVGYGHDPGVEQETGNRYVRRNRLNQTPVAGASAYRQQGAYVYANNTGWACFRDDASGRWLVGVASRTSGEASTFVSTYFHRDWLRAELLHATMSREGPP